MIQISMAIGRRLLDERCDQLRWNGCGFVVCCDFDGSFVFRRKLIVVNAANVDVLVAFVDVA
jgi:hypothetical protein